MKSIKNILQSSEYKEFALARTKHEHDNYFAAAKRRITNQEAAYSLIVMALATKTSLGEGYSSDAGWGFISLTGTSVYHRLVEMVTEYKLDQKIILSWVPEIFDQCVYAGNHGDFHRFFSEVLTDEQIFQDYLRAVEPRIFSWDEWFDVIQSFTSHKEAEKAMTKQFLSNDHLERFQGSIYDTEWRMLFLEKILGFCDEHDLLKVKHACWKILADEAVYGMNAEWLISHYGYEEMMGPNKNKFEKLYLSNALSCLKRQSGFFFSDDYRYRKAWDLDFDTSAFKKTRKLNKFLQIRHQLRETDALRVIEDADSPIATMRDLHRIYLQDPEVIKSNEELFATYRKIPETILLGLQKNDFKLEPDDIILLKQETLWDEGMQSIELYLTSQSKETRLMQDMQMLAKNHDSGFIDKAKQLQDIGFENFESKAQEEFLYQFLNGKDSDYPPNFFYDSSFTFMRLTTWSEDGMRDAKGNWVNFGEWSGGEEWEPNDNKDEDDDLAPIYNPDQKELF